MIHEVVTTQAIYNSKHKGENKMAIGNPIGFKVMRSLLVIPENARNQATYKGLESKLMFVAQLLGFKNGSKQDKIDQGWAQYLSSEFHECDYNDDTAEEVFENMWLHRLYQDLDNAFGNSYKLSIYKQRASKGKTLPIDLPLVPYKWAVPIEIDMSASVLGYLGLLLSHKPFLDRCNITQGNLTDAWAHDIITNRKQFKSIMRQCYGSQMSAQDMWNEMEIAYTQEEVQAFNKEMESGDIAVAIKFKDFIIDNCQMQPEMQLHVLNEKAATFCNRFHIVGEDTTIFDLYDSTTDSIRTIHNTSIKQVPDLKSFKRYAVTGLIHNLDGQVMDNTVYHVINKYVFCLPIHDAAILCCEAADYAREIYTNGTTPDEPSLAHIHTNRKSILQNYFRSVNIPASAVKEWKLLQRHVIPLEEPLVVNPMVLK